MLADPYICSFLTLSVNTGFDYGSLIKNVSLGLNEWATRAVIFLLVGQHKRVALVDRNFITT